MRETTGRSAMASGVVGHDGDKREGHARVATAARLLGCGRTQRKQALGDEQVRSGDAQDHGDHDGRCTAQMRPYIAEVDGGAAEGFGC